MAPSKSRTADVPATPGRGGPSRDRLIDAALRAFAVKGFLGCTTRDIARAARMSPAAVYVHYESKEEMLFLISKQGHEITLQQVRSAQASSESPVEQLSAMVRGFVFDHAHGHLRARVNSYELAHLSAHHYEIIAVIRREVEDRFCSVIVAGQRLGQFANDDARTMTRALLSLGIDTARWFRDEGDISPQDLADQYVTLALRLVGAKGAVSRRRPPKS